MICSAYKEGAVSERMCRKWFSRFQNGDFGVEMLRKENSLHMMRSKGCPLYYELLKPGQTIKAEIYQQQLIRVRFEEK